MGRPRRHIPLNVFLSGRLVGRLNRQSSGTIEFQYDPSWLASVDLSTAARGGENGSLKDLKTLWLDRFLALY